MGSYTGGRAAAAREDGLDWGADWCGDIGKGARVLGSPRGEGGQGAGAGGEAYEGVRQGYDEDGSGRMEKGCLCA